jgi:hypothetical protein
LLWAIPSPDGRLVALNVISGDVDGREFVN